MSVSTKSQEPRAKSQRLCIACQAPLGSVKSGEHCKNCADLRPCLGCGGPRDQRHGGYLRSLCKACARQALPCKNCGAKTGEVKLTGYCETCARLRPCVDCGGVRDRPMPSRAGGLDVRCQACYRKRHPLKRCQQCGTPIGFVHTTSGLCQACAGQRPCTVCGGPRDRPVRGAGGHPVYAGRCRACERKWQRQTYWKTSDQRASQKRRARKKKEISG